ncbi:hypothetical protein EVAR_92073_1 [Eumeta japonica]|uniref:Uncharacterized protein n=1 Tax=Eumeta variegata TaxID=151549 RepID=A0A4C1T0Z9_EUMVA|nr:hypothetical protein EVAR_92073_1 [Eumeta japonica]
MGGVQRIVGEIGSFVRQTRIKLFARRTTLSEEEYAAKGRDDSALLTGCWSKNEAPFFFQARAGGTG